ncbi:TPA: NAD-dependent ubiquitin ligase, partial [Legionella pneumophila]|nr:NAD-dependent ubiquitin ligase [Legionella pneumophila]
MPKYVEGVELTQEGMHAILARMGHGDITSGSIYNGVPTIDTEALNRQGFMPILT